MKKILNTLKTNPYLWAASCAFLMSFLLFSVFLGQGMWSDVITFRKNGDDMLFSFPSMIKMQEFLSKHLLQGVDTGTFNGATEFFPRSNMPNMYIPFIFTAFLSKFFPARFMYLLLYFVQMFFCTYFSIRLAQRFFDFNSKISLLFAASVSVIALYEEWYLSYYLAVTLICPALYIELCALDNKKRINYLLYAFPYVLCFTTGYITISVALAAFIFLSTMIIGIYYRKDLSWKQVIINSLIPAAIGGFVSFAYCIELLEYVKNVVKHASSTLHETLYYRLAVLDLKRIVSTAFFSQQGIEQINLITIGLFWIFIIFLIVHFHIYSKMKKREKVVLKIGICLYVFTILTALGNRLPFALWFYSFVPIFGSMHLPLRYLMIFLPLLYLGFSMTISYMPDLKGNKCIRIFIVGIFALIIMLLSLPSASIGSVCNVEMLLLEMVFMLIVFVLLYMKGIYHYITIIAACFSIMMPGIMWLYQLNEVDILKSQMEERSMVYNIENQQRLDYLIARLNNKDRYTYVAFDHLDGAPTFMPGNYQWYHLSAYPLSNYMGYELQLCLPIDYLNKFPWFDRIDWNYVINTRGDFLILDDASIEENKEILNPLVDWEKSDQYISGTYRFCQLKKFVPFYYTNGVLLEDHPDAMDNGYFYSHDLRNDALTEFHTDDATYYDATINASVDTEISFLLYPNRFYHYYVNGEQINPIVDNMQVYIPLSKGENTVHIVYENQIAKIKNLIFLGYYTSVLLVAFSNLLGNLKFTLKK